MLHFQTNVPFLAQGIRKGINQILFGTKVAVRLVFVNERLFRSGHDGTRGVEPAEPCTEIAVRSEARRSRD